MNSPSFEGQNRFSNPQEELSKIREETIRRVSEARERGMELSVADAAHEKVKQYSNTPANEILHPKYEMKDREADAIVLELSPEAHDRQMEEILGILEEQGIRNALKVVERLGNPHILDDFHRILIQYIATGHMGDLKENDELWKPLHMALFEVSLPEAEEEEKKKQLKELISGMEQFYAAMISVSGGASGEWISMEVANRNGSDEVVFYVGVPKKRKELLEKQILAIFPKAHVHEHKDDYNIFNEKGVTVGSSAKLEKHFMYPLKPYAEFDTDPLNAILNGFSKIDKDGEGAAIQLVIGKRRDDFAKNAEKAIEKIRKGEKASDALKTIDGGMGSMMMKEALSVFKGKKTLEKEKEDKAKRAQALDQTGIEQFTNKLRSPLIAVNLRVLASAATESEAQGILHDIQSSFNQFENGLGNRIGWENALKYKVNDLAESFSLREWNEKEAMILNLEEMTSCMHFPAKSTGTVSPQLKQSKAGTAPMPMDMPTAGTLIGINKHRGSDGRAYISNEDRMRHFYVIGQTGTGKTVLLKNMILQDIAQGAGACFIDPHGSDIQDILANIPQNRLEDVIYFDPSSTDRPMALNMLEYDTRFPDQKTFVVNEMFNIFQKLYGKVPESMGPIFEQYFRNATGLVIEDPESGSTLLDVSRVMSNKAFRELKISKCKNPVIVQFWKEIAEKAGGEASLANVVPYITSKFDVFLANEIMRPIIAQEKSSFNIREIMDSRKILLVNLSKGRLGDINSHLIGLILVGKILMAALSRVDSIGKNIPDFYLYLDEFQNITTDSISTILSEARKYRLSLTVAHQFIGQLDEKIKNSVFGNVGSMASFRVGTEDAEFLEKQFAPVFTANDIMNLDNYNAYVKLLANGRPTKPFSIETIAPEKGDPVIASKLKELSALTFGRPRAEVEEEVMGKYKNLKS